MKGVLKDVDAIAKNPMVNTTERRFFFSVTKMNTSSKRPNRDARRVTSVSP